MWKWTPEVPEKPLPLFMRPAGEHEQMVSLFENDVVDPYGFLVGRQTKRCHNEYLHIHKEMVTLINWSTTMSISSKELRSKITAWGLSQAEFARWLQVSAGAVAQWLAETRSIPGPVNAFIKLFEGLPQSLQERELSQLKKGNAEMEGMYVVEFAGSGGQGGASLTFKDGLVYGFDLGGGIYDGRYRPSEIAGMTIVEVSVNMPAGRPSVIMGIKQPFDWTVLAKAEIPNNAQSAAIRIVTNMGETLHAKFTRMRDLPIAA